MNHAVILSVALLAFSVPQIALSQDPLPDDVRSALPSPSHPELVRPAEALAKELPVFGDSFEESADQLLERAILRYRNIVEQGANGRWEVDVAERLNRLEEVLKRLAKEQAKAATEAAPDKLDAAAPPADKPEATEPTPPKPSLLREGSPAVPIPHAPSGLEFEPSPVVPASAVEEALPAQPHEVLKPILCLDVETTKSLPPESPGASPGQPLLSAAERAKQLEALATQCEGVAQFLRETANELRRQGVRGREVHPDQRQDVQRK